MTRKWHGVWSPKQSVGLLAVLLCLLTLTAPGQEQTERSTESIGEEDFPQVIVLGVAQDAGYPQAGCRRECCQRAWTDPTLARSAICLGIADPRTQQRWMVECTPDFKTQLHTFDSAFPPRSGLGLDGILITHGHIGHYAGLIHLGREVMGAKGVPVHVMPRMKAFLETSGPWSQLVTLQNIELLELADASPVQLNERIRVVPLLVPHRGEYSETVAFRIEGPNRKILFLPDIDRWEEWPTGIERAIREVDVAFLDATFFDGNELPGRSLDEIPHPLVCNSIERFGALGEADRRKVHFLHFNHTNPLLDSHSEQAARVRKAGMIVTEQGSRFGL